jgi:hypothetical protein
MGAVESLIDEANCCTNEKFMSPRQSIRSIRSDDESNSIVVLKSKQRKNSIIKYASSSDLFNE